jgi:hypothetical protein
MVGEQLEAEIAAEDVLAQETSLTGFIQCSFEQLVLFEDFTVDVVVAALYPWRSRR